MKKQLLLLSIGLVCAGCTSQQAHVYREPNSQEINSFVPYNYQLYKSNQNQPTGDTIQVSFDQGQNKEFLLLVQPTSGLDSSGSPSAKAMLIEYNAQNDSWGLVKNYDFKGYSNFGGDARVDNIQVTDLNHDGINEVLFNVSNTAPDGNMQIQPVALTMEQGNLVNLFPDGVTDNYSDVYDDQTQTYTLDSYIWGQNEAHYGCHHFDIQKYTFNGKAFASASDYKTQNVYYNDSVLTPITACPQFDIYSPSPF